MILPPRGKDDFHDKLCHGPNSRFVVTHQAGWPQRPYEEVYCQRGDAENRIKEQPLGLFAGRTSCHDFAANQFRVLLSAAYILLDHLCQQMSTDFELTHPQADTIHLKLRKIGARPVCSVRRIVIHLAQGNPPKNPFFRILGRLRTPPI